MHNRGFHTELLDEFTDNGDDTPDRWVVSYADFITLMFAFFVVMYSISSVNDGKFRVLSQTMLEVFSNPEVAAVVEQRLMARAERAGSTAGQALGAEDAAEKLDWSMLAALEPADVDMVLDTLLAQPIADSAVQIRTSEDWTEVELRSDVAFDANTHGLTPAAAQTIAGVAELARALDVAVRVEGFTDDVPPTGTRYRTNRAVSAAHAATVADALVAGGVAAGQVTTTAFGDLHPLASNATAAGRSQNRRVVINIARHGDVGSPAASLAARPTLPEQLPARGLSRVDQLPGAETIQL